MSDRPAAPPELRSLLTELFGVERELAQQGSSLAQQGAGDASAWLMLVEQAAARLRRSAQLLEEAIDPRSADGEKTAAKAGDPSNLASAANDQAALGELLRGSEPAQEQSPRARKAPGSEGVLTGHALVIPISELLSFLSGLRKSGMLWVDTPRESFLLQLQDGAIVYAHGDNPPQGQLLGEILVRNDALARDKLAWALVESAAGKDVLGGHLVRKGLIGPADLTRALAEQAQMIFDRLFGSHDATYQFELGGRLIDSADVRLNVIQLLLESARATDECRLRVEVGAGVPLARAT